MPTDSASRLRQLLVMVPWLVERGRVPLAEVVERFGVPERDLIGLLELVACCGVPPYTPDQLIDLVVGEGWVEAWPGPHLRRPFRLSPAEGFALAASARALLAMPGAEPDGALARAVGKLEAALGTRGRLVVEVDASPLLEPARRAVERHERVVLRYYSAGRDELTTREVDPLLLYSREGHWYLDGWCHLAGGLRHFRLDRVRSLSATGVVVEPAAVPEGAGSPVPGDETTTVVLDLSPQAHWVVETYPTLQAIEQDGGTLRVTLNVGGIAWLERLLLRLGPAARLVDPPVMAEVPADAARRVLARYRASQPPG